MNRVAAALHKNEGPWHSHAAQFRIQLGSLFEWRQGLLVVPACVLPERDVLCRSEQRGAQQSRSGQERNTHKQIP